MQKQEMILPLNTKIDLSLTKIDKFEKKCESLYPKVWHTSSSSEDFVIYEYTFEMQFS